MVKYVCMGISKGLKGGGVSASVCLGITTE